MSMDGWSERKKLKHRLLRRAIEQNRGAEVILLIQWRLAQENHQNKGLVELLRKFEAENEGQPRALRSLNLHAAHKNLPVVYKDSADTKIPDPDSRRNIGLKQLFTHLNDTGLKDEQIHIHQIPDQQNESSTASKAKTVLSGEDALDGLILKPGMKLQ